MSSVEYGVNLSNVPMPSRKGRLETYLWDKGDEVSANLAEDLYDPLRPLAPYGVLIPVAAHQESGRIAAAMDAYANQEGAEAFSILLYLNAAHGADFDKVLQTAEEVKKAQHTYPHLDIRYAMMTYEEPIIGQIRKDLWDACARVALADGLYEKPGSEFIGINHDIDTVSIGKHYVRNIQSHYRALQTNLDGENLSDEPLSSRFTQVKHAYPFTTHPNIAKSLFWTEFALKQFYRHGIYEEGIVIPFSYYAMNDGFDETFVLHETRLLAPRNQEGIPGTIMETSPRRYIARIGEHALARIWTSESFTASDACRDPAMQMPDITHEALEERIMETLYDDLCSFAGSVPRKKWLTLTAQMVHADFIGSGFEQLDQTLNARITDLLAPRLALARNILERVVGSPLLASMIDASLLTAMAQEYESIIREDVHDQRIESLTLRTIS